MVVTAIYTAVMPWISKWVRSFGPLNASTVRQSDTGIMIAAPNEKAVALNICPLCKNARPF